MVKTRLLFLGYGENETKLISHLQGMNFEVHHFRDQESMPKDLSGFTHLISFGYRRLLIPEQLSQIRGAKVNLHMSLLPWNRGSHPIFWSFMEGTPLGVSIHEIVEALDEGAIVVQRQVELDPRQETFRTAYEKCKRIIEELFIENLEAILTIRPRSVPQSGCGSYHRTADLPKDFGGWDLNIKNEIDRLSFGEQK